MFRESIRQKQFVIKMCHRRHYTVLNTSHSSTCPPKVIEASLDRIFHEKLQETLIEINLQHQNIEKTWLYVRIERLKHKLINKIIFSASILNI